MGRRRRKPEWGSASGGLGVDPKTARIVEERLGHLNPVCANCKVTARKGATHCRKCGKAELRRSAQHPQATSPDQQGFRGKGHEGSGW